MKLGDNFRNVSISSGTYKTDSIFESVKGFLTQELIDLYEDCIINDERDEVLNEDIWEHLNNIAPEGCYFGSHSGDGSDFGFWEYEKEE